MKKILLLTAALGAASMALADQNATENLPPLTVKTQSDALPWLLSTKPELTDTGFADRMRRFSGFSQTSSTQIGTIEGAPSRFTALYWEGMNVSDATGIDRQATFVNTLLLSGDRIRLAQGAVQPIYGKGGSGAILIDQRADAPSRIALGGSNQGERFQSGQVRLEGPIDGYVAAESRFSSGYTAYAAEAGKLDADSEKDESRSVSYRGVVNVPVGKRLTLTIKALDATAQNEYDGGWPTDADDSTHYWDTRLTMQGYEAAYKPADNVALKAGFHRQYNRREDSDTTVYTGNNRKTFAQGDYTGEFAGFSLGAESLSEEAEITGTLEGENRQNDLTASAWVAAAEHRIDLALRQVRFDPDEGKKVNDEGYYLGWRYGIKLGGAEYQAGLSTARAVQPPSLIQQLNPYGDPNDNLQTERLDQKRLNLGAQFGAIEVSVAAFKTEIENYINWVSDPSDWTIPGKYENVDRVSFKGGYLHVSYRPIEGLLIYADQTRLLDYESSAASLKDRQSDRTTTAGLSWQYGRASVGYDLRIGNEYTDAASGETLKGEKTSTLSAGYETNKGQTVQLTIKNLQDDYRESAYGYTPAVPERTIYLALEQQF